MRCIKNLTIKVKANKTISISTVECGVFLQNGVRIYIYMYINIKQILKLLKREKLLNSVL